MNVPSSVKVGAFIIAVNRDPFLMASREAYGEYHPSKLEIVLDTNLNKQKEGETLLHEMLEAIDAIYDIELDHHKLSLMATALHQVVIENPNIFKELRNG